MALFGVSRGTRWALLSGLMGGVLVLIALRVWVLNIFQVTSPSMAPTILVGDRVLVSLWGFPSSMPERGDVIVFLHEGTPWMKRVLGVPGDHVAIKDNAVSVNDIPVMRAPVGEASFDESGDTVEHPVKLAERTLFQESLNGRQWQVAQRREATPVSGDWTVPPEQLFVAGDNRDASEDSRDPTIGFVPAHDVVGVVTRVVYSSGPKGARARTWTEIE